MIYLVRHAHAGHRTTAPGDEHRQLSAKGRREALTLSRWLVPGAGGEIYSSPYRRCVATVELLAAPRDAEIIISEALEEGAATEPLLELLTTVPDESVLCTHGDMLRKVIAALEQQGTVRHRRAAWEKGTVWALARDGTQFPHAVAIAPKASEKQQRLEELRSLSRQLAA